MRRHRRIAVLLLVALTLAAGCGDGDANDAVEIDLSDDELTSQAGTWVNFLGLTQTDPEVWRSRLERACTEGVWETEVAEALAQEFIDEDMVLSVRVSGDRPSVEMGASALWLVAISVCRDSFPDGEIEEVPPFFDG